ncbi:MAG: response regulator, partial [Chloroflexi bacterium]
NINEMISNLRETTQKTKEQDWLKTNLARFTRMLQGQRDLLTVSRLILSELAPLINAEYGAFYGMVNPDSSEPYLMFQAGYAYKPRKDLGREFRLGEGLVGQCALDKRPIQPSNVPPDYIRITSGLGQASPLNILILPVLFEGEVRAVIELASFQHLSPIHRDFLDQLTDSIGVVLNNIQANGRTESLLRQSQSLANELQSQQDQLQRTNADLEEKANQLAQQNAEIEMKRAEVEDAKNMLEEKAEQLAVTSRFKSEFLANMSHELRTPLNSLLILAQELAENPDGNLLPKQVEYATIIRSSGSDLLKLINDILDISKIESGTVALEISDFPVADIELLLERTFRHVADVTKLAFTIDLDPTLPETIPIDPQRLQQVLNNLLSNAFKFTEKGKVEFRAAPATSGWTLEALSQAEGVVALSVTDTGIGIPLDMQRSIFEAFSQGDGTTSRKFGGTGLGLSICRELVSLLGGEITLESQPGKGSTFTVYLPAGTVPPPLRPVVEAPSNGTEVLAQKPSSRVPALVAAATNAPQAERPATAVQPARAKGRRRRADEVVIAAPVSVATGEEGLRELKGHKFDVAVIDLGLPGMSGWEVIERIRSTKTLRSTALVVYTARDLNRQEEMKLARATRSVVVKEVRSAERLRDEISSLLSQPRANEAETHSETNGNPDPALAGKKVLVVDDDIRNIFALTAMLERQGMQVIAVDNGQNALEVARDEPDISIALVDVMMPEMDGFATMSHMRKLPKLKNLPIVALTAKAMKGDREKCIEAGASDYIAKPINSAHLLSMLRAWLTG